MITTTDKETLKNVLYRSLDNQLENLRECNKEIKELEEELNKLNGDNGGK